MSLNVSAARRPDFSSWPLGAAIGIVSVFVAVTAALYLAGYFLLWSIGESPLRATPLSWYRYWHWYADLPRVRLRLLISAAVGALPLLFAAVLWMRPIPRPLHGAARFATRREIARAGLLGERGILLGKIGRRYLMLDGQQGVALAAPPRAGKGVGVVIPNALNWPGSLVCVDIKRENWDCTAGYRSAAGQACFLFDPLATDGETARWNPLWYVPEEPAQRVSGLQQIAEMLYPDPLAGDPFWTASARSLFLGIALYLFETPGKPHTLGEVLRHGMANDAEGFEEHWRRIIEGRQRGAHPLSRVCVQALYDVIKLSPITCSSIRKTFTSRLDLWLNPILDRATSDNDFDLRTLRERGQSIYVAVRPDNLHRLRPVLNLFFQQAIGLQTQELPEQNPKLKVPVLMLLDEFTALGRLPIIAEAISYLPGYNVRVVLVIQSPSQLREVYGVNNAETMMKSLAARIVFAPKDVPDAREISEELGYVTVKTKSRSQAGFGFGKAARTPTVNESEQRRALRLPQELKELGTDQAIVFYEGLAPILCRKVRYYQERVFRERLLPPPRPRPPGVSAPPVALIDAVPELAAEGGEIHCDDAESDAEGESPFPSTERIDPKQIGTLTLADFVVNAKTEAAVAAVAALTATAKAGEHMWPSNSEVQDCAAAFLASFER